MLNYNTIISSFDDKVTLMKWLKIVDENLKNGSVLTFKVNKKGNATISFSIVFADGSEIETGYIVLAQGESVESASIVNGHLILVLTNGTQIDAGNVKPITSVAFDASRHLIVTFGDGTTQDAGLVKGVSSFSIDANQHLIVTYDNDTTEDLGLIFNGDINCNNINATQTITARKLRQSVSNNSATIDTIYPYASLTHEIIYNRYEEINGVLYLIINMKLTNETGDAITINAGQRLLSMTMYMGNEIGNNLIDLSGNSVSSAIATRTLITSFCGFFTKDINDRNNNPSNLDCHFFNEPQATMASVYCVTNDAITINASQSGYVTARVALTLI